MRCRWWVAIAIVAGCSSKRADPPNKHDDNAAASAQPAAAAPIRWMWITGMGGPFLTYYYVDRAMGPSAKGAHVDDPATAAQLDAVVNAPTNTFRDPIAMEARAATADEVAALKLPDRPPWLATFEPAGTPPPAVPKTAQLGRPPRTHGATFSVQYACGPFAGGYQTIDAGEMLEIGAKKPEGRDKRIVIDDAGVPDKAATLVNRDGLSIEPVAGAQIVVNGKPVADATKLAIDDRIEIGKRTLIIRAESFTPTSPGPDPSCPGFADQLWIQDGCAMYGTSFSQLMGGDEMIVGTDKPERYLRGYKPAVQVRVRLVNHAGTVEFTALDPKHPPKVKGKPMVQGKLAVGSVIAVGDRVFAIAKDDRGKAIIESPAASCPEAKQKAAEKQR